MLSRTYLNATLISVLTLTSLFFFNTIQRVYAESIPVRFSNFLPDMRIEFTTFLPDEVWYVSGKCTGAFEYLTLEVTNFLPDKTIELTTSRFLADKSICIQNPDDAPDEFWEAYKK